LYLGARMKERLQFFAHLFFYWMVFFTTSRLLFLLYLYPHTRQLTGMEMVTPLVLGLRMDAAMTGYWMLLPGLLFTASPFLSSHALKRTLNFITLALLLLSSVVIVSDLELYKHWGFRINATPLMYLEKEAAGSVDTVILLMLVMIFVLLVSLFAIYNQKILNVRLTKLPPMEKRWSFAWLLITGLLLIPIRSSFSVAPLNTGAVYFHKTKSFPNHAGINPVWNFLRSVLHDNSGRYPENFFPAFRDTFDSLMASGESTQRLVNTTRPNVLLIILESFTAKIIDPLGGLEGITPNFNALAREGLLFTNFYSSGDRTDKGLVSILSSYPAQPKTSIIKFPDKTQHLPFLSRVLEKSGYTTSFVYGGDIGFANMKSYLTAAGFRHITDADDFDEGLDQSKWGVADEFVFNQLLHACDSARQPFFKVMLTLSSHEPFEVPMKPVFAGNDERAKFLNACYYADQSLGAFIRLAKQRPWWENTLVIITADHGHRFPDAEELKEKSRFHIPMLWLGGALTKTDSTINTLAGHTDISNTLLGQLSASDSSFTFSKNIFGRKAKPFAVYIFNNGYGYISSDHESVYDFDLKNFIYLQGDEREADFGKAYMQKLFHDYNKR
jgi:phosphoglycerol transferase MdoB-like AlkP superfamily enzyme